MIFLLWNNSAFATMVLSYDTRLLNWHDKFQLFTVHTILPSPLPRSTNVPLAFPADWSILKTLVTCCSVAGTYGKHILRNAGRTKGVAMAYRPPMTAPDTPTRTRPPLSRRFEGDFIFTSTWNKKSQTLNYKFVKAFFFFRNVYDFISRRHQDKDFGQRGNCLEVYALWSSRHKVLWWSLLTQMWLKDLST